MTENFIELYGDRNVKDDKAMVGGFASLGGETVMIIGQQKGINTKMRQLRNFGMANPEGYRKALRLMRLAEKFRKPIVCLVDTPGAYPGLEAEERGQGEAIARNLYEMTLLKVPVICIIIGEGASGGALGIGAEVEDGSGKFELIDIPAEYKADADARQLLAAVLSDAGDIELDGGPSMRQMWREPRS